MLTIIEIETRDNNRHCLESQSGRKECWLDGWITVPETLAEKVWACHGYGDLVIEDGVLVDFVPTERPEPEVEEFTDTDPESDQDAMLIDQEYRLTLLELGLTE